MASMKSRIDHLARQVPPARTSEERLRDQIAGMTSGERRKCLAELTLKGTLGRQPTPAEIRGFSLAPLTADHAAFFAEAAERHGLTRTAASFREMAAARCTTEGDSWDDTES